MEKSSSFGSVRVSRIKTLLKRENLSQKDLAGKIFVKARKGKGLTPMEPQNLNKMLCSGNVSEKLCRKIVEIFPQYNLMWLLGDSDLMLNEDVHKDYIERHQATNNAYIQVLDAALREVYDREGIKPPTLNNIPELLLLQGQLKDFANALMFNYTKNREQSHFWGTLDQELKTIEEGYLYKEN